MEDESQKDGSEEDGEEDVEMEDVADEDATEGEEDTGDDATEPHAEDNVDAFTAFVTGISKDGLISTPKGLLQLAQALDGPDTVIWLHSRLWCGGAKPWIASCSTIPSTCTSRQSLSSTSGLQLS